MTFPFVSGDDLVALLGLEVQTPAIQRSLSELAHGMQPELDPDDDEVLVDWVTVNETGLEYGFEDEAYVRALDPSKRRDSPLILSQLYFYGDTEKTQPFPFPLPFGLTFNDTRYLVRQKLGAYETSRRSYIRDAWRLPSFDVTVAYQRESGKLESVFCHLPYAPWEPIEGNVELLVPFTPEFFANLFGLRWSNEELRRNLAPLGFDGLLGEVRAEHTADLRFTVGLELIFAQSHQILMADQKYPLALTFAGVTFYANRELDAREWAGLLPFGLAFADTQTDLRVKIGRAPEEITDEDRSGLAVWHFARFTLNVVYSNIENRILRVTMLAPGFWERITKADHML
jgi:hypothetical protein